MLNKQSGMKYREKIERKLSLAARQPTGALCDLDPLEDIFEDKKDTDEKEDESADEAPKMNKSQKKKMKKKKANNMKNGNSLKSQRRSGEMFEEILAVSDNDDWAVFAFVSVFRWRKQLQKLLMTNCYFYLKLFRQI